MGRDAAYSIGRRILGEENYWEDLTPETYRITKPTVLCFGGNGTTEPKYANGMCRVAQSLVGLKPKTAQNEIAIADDVDFVGIAYGGSYLTREEQKDFVNNLFLPLCFDEQGSLLPNEQIIKNFNKITFFAHCYGATEIDEIINRTMYEMNDLGIDEHTTEEAINQMFAVVYAPYDQCSCNSLQVVSMEDKTLISLNAPRQSRTTKKFRNDRIYYAKCICEEGTTAFMEDEKTVSVLVSNMTLDTRDEHGAQLVERDDNWRMVEELSTYYGNEVSKVMGYALASSVANSIENMDSETLIPKPTPDEILQDSISILGRTLNKKFEETINQIQNPNEEQLPEIQP